MKKEFQYSYGKYEFVIWAKAELYYLKLDGVLKIRTDNINIARSYIDGWIDCKKNI